MAIEVLDRMQKTERSNYTPLDFTGWRESQTLVLAPKFQRRGVWTSPARSFLIDTLLRGMPVPPIYLRVGQSADKKKVIREVVDGQQRISAVLDFLDDKYALSKSLEAKYAGKFFSELSSPQQDTIRQYSFITEVLHGASDAEVLEIFSRLNTYSVPLNAQELRNGTYFGYFKQTAYGLAHEHIEFWRRHRIFSERRIARMKEVELTSELMIAQLDGLQDKKSSIGSFYAEYDDEFKDRGGVIARFKTTIDAIEDSVGDVLRDSEFRRPPIFYSLYCALYHRIFGLPKQKMSTPKRKLSDKEDARLKSATLELSDDIIAGRNGKPVKSDRQEFVAACLSQTDNIQPRQTRLEAIYKTAF